MTVKVFYNADKIKELSGKTVTVLSDGSVLVIFYGVDELIKYTPGNLEILFESGESLNLRNYDFFSVKN